MRRFVSVLLVTVCLFALGCSGTKILADWDRRIDFSKFSTFGYGIDSEEGEFVVREIIEALVADQLRAKGMRLDEGSPDLKIFVQGSSGENIRIQPFAYNYTPYGGWGGWYGYGWGGYYNYSTIATRDVQVGTVIVDLVVAETSELVWRGYVRAAISDTAKDEKRIANVESILTRMFVDFPPPLEAAPTSR
ncbi:MAG: DUF4136 domain-containing protein [bacterium]|nr:DUF4136 domain-containing protein [bacterium]